MLCVTQRSFVPSQEQQTDISDMSSTLHQFLKPAGAKAQFYKKKNNNNLEAVCEVDFFVVGLF